MTKKETDDFINTFKTNNWDACIQWIKDYWNTDYGTFEICKEKGNKVRKVRDMLIERFGDASPIPVKILKGKSLQRVFWSVVTIENMDEINVAIEEVAG